MERPTEMSLLQVDIPALQRTLFFMDSRSTAIEGHLDTVVMTQLPDISSRIDDLTSTLQQLEVAVDNCRADIVRPVKKVKKPKATSKIPQKDGRLLTSNDEEEVRDVDPRIICMFENVGGMIESLSSSLSELQEKIDGKDARLSLLECQAQAQPRGEGSDVETRLSSLELKVQELDRADRDRRRSRLVPRMEYLEEKNNEDNGLKGKVVGLEKRINNSKTKWDKEEQALKKRITNLEEDNTWSKCFKSVQDLEQRVEALETNIRWKKTPHDSQVEKAWKT